MGFKYHFVYLNENGQHDSVDIAAGSLDEALQLFRRDHGSAFIAMICVL